MRAAVRRVVVAAALALVVGAPVAATWLVPTAVAGDDAAVEALVTQMLGPDAKASGAAADVLVTIGAAAVPKLAAAAAASGNVPSRVLCLATLGRIAVDHDE